jgi:hypothetical protein
VVAASKERTARSQAVKAWVINLDAGNGYFKMVAPDGRHISFVAAVKLLKSYEIEDVAQVDSNSALVTLAGQVFAFGELAQMLGGQSLFEAGKVEHTAVAVAAAIAIAGLTTEPVKLRLLVPDASKAEWKAAARALPNQVMDFHARVAGQDFARYQPRVEVALVSEGYPVWNYAHRHGQIPFELSDRPLIGVIDAGTGDLTCSVWMPNGTLVRSAGSAGQVSFSTGAMKELAGEVGAGFAHLCQHTPDRGRILEIIKQQGNKPAEDRRYIYEERGQAHDFTGIFQEAVKAWNKALLQRLVNDNWAQIWGQLSMVFIVGGAADLLAPLENATGGRFKVVRLPQTAPQMVNAVLMSYLD